MNLWSVQIFHQVFFRPSSLETKLVFFLVLVKELGAEMILFYFLCILHSFAMSSLMKLLVLNCMSDQDSVRLLAFEGCAALGKLLEPQDCAAHILPVIVNFSQVYP